MSAIRLRILSDLHFAEPASRITTLMMLAPLLDTPERLIFNGDSFDTRFLKTDPISAAGHAVFSAFTAPLRPRLTLITGNHDPDVSPHHHLELAQGRVLITHGDVLFPEVAPWGWEAPHVLEARRHRLATIDPTLHDTLETELEVCKYTSLATSHLAPASLHQPPSFGLRIVHLLGRIRRADQILRAWMRSSQLADQLATRFRPQAQVVIFGHTHFPGVWQHGNRTIINTGAFTPPLGSRLVDFHDDCIRTRTIERQGGEFRPGKVIHELPWEHGCALHTCE